MTYPYPQNPQDPYNQGGGYQQQGGYPQSGGFPAQGGYPQGDYSQQGYPQTGGFPAQGGGYPPGPPKKSNTPVIITIVAVVVIALGALGITGFVAPGFFLSDDKEGSEDGGKTGTQAGGGGGTAQALAEQIVAGINSKDQAALQALKCPDADEDIDQMLSQLSIVQSATLTGPVQEVDATHATASVSIVTTQGPLTGSGSLTKQGEKWCWSDVSGGGESGGTTGVPSIPSASVPAAPSSSPGATGGTSGTPGSSASLMTDFISKVNAKDSSGANALACSENSSSVSSTVSTATSGTASVQQDGTPSEGSTSSLVDLTGTLNGASAQGLLGAHSDDNGSTWCIDYFSFY